MSFTLASEQRVLVRVPSWVGDAVMAEPVLAALHAHHARAGKPEHVSFAGPKRLLELFDGRFEGARRIPSSGQNGDHHADWRGHDLALLLTGSMRTALCAWRAGIPLRAGWARDGRGPLLTHGVRPARERGGVALLLGRSGRSPRILPRPFGAACVELAGLVGLAVARTQPRLDSTARGAGAARARLDALGLAPAEPFVLANVGARADSAKAFPPAQWARTLEHLEAHARVAIVLAGAPGEEAAVAEVARLSSARDLRPCLAPQPGLAELVGLCEAATLVLCADGGARHVALAAGAPVALVAGPTDLRHTAEHLRHQRWVRTVVPCGPCHLEHCPKAGAEYHACMLGVQPEQFAAAARELLLSRS